MPATKSTDVTKLAGFRSVRTNPLTGSTIVVLENTTKAGFTGDESEPWVAYCATHDNFVTVPRRRDARAEAQVPEQWCPGCKKAARKVS